MTDTSTLGQLCGEQVRCATYNVYVRNRNTGLPVDGCNFTEQAAEGKWTRKYNTAADPVASTAEVAVNTSGIDPDCCECLPVPWRDELVVERLDRNGDFEQVVWIGPIWNVIDDSVFGELLVKAKDRSAWVWEEQDYITEPIKLTDVDEVDVWLAVWEHLERCGANTGLTPQPTPTGSIVSVEFEAYTAVADILQLIPNVYWSVAGDEMCGPGPIDLGQGTQPRATLDVGAHWDDQGAVVDYNGRASATCVLVRNQGTPAPVDLAAAASEAAAGLPQRDASGQFVAADAPPVEQEIETVQVTGPLFQGQYPDPCKPHPEFGLHKTLIVDESIGSDDEARQLAYDTYIKDHDGDAFLVTSAGSLSQEAPVAICDLKLGSAFAAVADTGCLEINQVMRLNNLVVDFVAEETGRGVVLKESRVATDLQPLGSTRTSESRVSI